MYFSLAAVVALANNSRIEELQLPLDHPQEESRSSEKNGGSENKTETELGPNPCAQWLWKARAALLQLCHTHVLQWSKSGSPPSPLCDAASMLSATHFSRVVAPRPDVAKRISTLLTALHPCLQPLGGSSTKGDGTRWYRPRWPLNCTINFAGNNTAPTVSWSDGYSAAVTTLAVTYHCEERDVVLRFSDLPHAVESHAEDKYGGDMVPQLLLPDYIYIRCVPFPERDEDIGAAASTSAVVESWDSVAVEVAVASVEALSSLTPLRRDGLQLFLALLQTAAQRAGHDGITDHTANTAPLVVRWRTELWDASDGVPRCPGDASYSPQKQNEMSGNGMAGAERVSTTTASSKLEASVLTVEEWQWPGHMPSEDDGDTGTGGHGPPEQKLLRLKNIVLGFASLWYSATEVVASAAAAMSDDSSSSASSYDCHDEVVRLLQWWPLFSAQYGEGDPDNAPFSLDAFTKPSLSVRCLPRGAAPLLGAIIFPFCFHLESAATNAETTHLPYPPLPYLVVCFVNPKGTYLYRYDLDAVSVLCRAVRSLNAKVCVYDEDQERLLMEILSRYVCLGEATDKTDSGSDTAASPPRVSLPWDAVATVREQCYTLTGCVRTAALRGSAAAPLSSTEPSSSPSTAVLPLWCSALHVPSCGSVLGRGSLRSLVGPFTPPPHSVSLKASSSHHQAKSRAQPEVAAAAPTLIQAPPPSFFSYAQVMISARGMEEVEQLSASVLQVARRLAESI